MKTAYIEADTVYSQLVTQETTIDADYQVWMESYSTMLAGAGDQLTLVNQCFSNTATVIAQAANSVFSKDANGNPVSAADENKAFINALGTGGSLYAGNVDKCQQAALDLMSYVRVKRDSLLGARTKIIDELRAYDLSQVRNLKIATVMHFYNQYGPELAQLEQKGETALLDAVASGAGLQPMPITFIGFPTSALKVESRSQDICSYYYGLYTGETKTPQNRNKELYLTDDWNPALKSCQLYRYSAYEYMSRAFLTQQASVRIDCGQDAGIQDKMNPDCTVSSPTAEPTKTK
ncbi:hypothetical protein M1116_02515 [Patescibacteria group bacterium]|nr:hypothetical protein [Patescibacteria group bacterium]